MARRPRRRYFVSRILRERARISGCDYNGPVCARNARASISIYGEETSVAEVEGPPRKRNLRENRWTGKIER